MHKKSSLETQLERALSSCDSVQQIDETWERFLTYFETVKNNVQMIYTDKRNEVTGNISNKGH